jgi:putative hydrolase of the HAD superfamily
MSLEHIDNWVFDLDNTLYPSECDLFAQIDVKMGTFISNLLNVDRDQASDVQKGFLMSHGTTLRGLMDHHGVEARTFLDYVHDIDMSPIPPNPALGETIAALPGRKFIFTNADRTYAKKVLAQLGIADAFDGLFDITDADFQPKPAMSAYHDFLKTHDVTPTRAIMFEDMARNLTPASQLGMTTAWIPTGSEWSSAHKVDDHIDHTVDDLTTWLAALPL